MESLTIDNLLRLCGFEDADPELAIIIQSLLLVSDTPLTLKRISELVPRYSNEEILRTFDALRTLHSVMGVKIHAAAGGYSFTTAPAAAPQVEQHMELKPQKLSKAALETLAVVAYLQPVTQLQVNEIRGVQSDSSLKYLVEKGFVKTVGRLEEPGRPILYSTTKEFLEFFGLQSLESLPPFESPPEGNEETYTQTTISLDKLMNAITTGKDDSDEEILNSLKLAVEVSEDVKSRESRLMTSLGIFHSDSDSS